MRSGKHLKPCGVGLLQGSPRHYTLNAFLHKHLVMQGWAVLSWRLSGYLIILLGKTNFRVAVIVLILSRDLTSHRFYACSPHPCLQ